MARRTKSNCLQVEPLPSGDDLLSAAAGPGPNHRNKRMRLRVAWMYFVEEMTQNEIAQHLEIGRATVIRLLADLRERNEIKFQIEHGIPECIVLERALEKAFGLHNAVVAPLSDPKADATIAVAAATGQYMSGMVRDGMRIGVGWGRTLHESLRFMSDVQVADLSVVSLLGGIAKVRRFNPSEFAWRFSSLFQAECYLMTAPAVVDSPRTRQTLIDHCGLGDVFENAKSLDAVLLSVGDVTSEGTPYRYAVLPEEMRLRFVEMGAVGDLLFHYFDRNGKLIEDPIQGRVMSVPVGTLKAVPQRIIASGGAQKVEALLGAFRLIAPTTLITDEHCARALVALADGGGPATSRAV